MSLFCQKKCPFFGLKRTFVYDILLLKNFFATKEPYPQEEGFLPIILYERAVFSFETEDFGSSS